MSEPTTDNNFMKAFKLSCFPTLGFSENSITVEAMDDATKAFFFPIESLKKCPMGFLHIKFLLEVLTIFQPNYPELVELVEICQISLDLTRLRQYDLVHEINEVISQKGGKQHTITQKAKEFVLKRDEIIENAKSKEFDVERYLTINPDDIEQSTNDWNMNQNKEKGKASDYVLVVRDTKNKWFVVVIERAFGPSRGDAAFPGGFLEKCEGFMGRFEENFKDCAKREFSEETEITMNHDKSVTNSVYKGSLSVISSPSDDEGQEFMSWDVRAKLVEGMINGGEYEVRVYSC